MFSTWFVSVESPRLTKLRDLFVKVGIPHLCSAERRGQDRSGASSPEEATANSKLRVNL